MLFLIFLIAFTIYDLIFLKILGITINVNLLHSLIYNSFFSLLLASICIGLGKVGLIIVGLAFFLILVLFITEIGLYSAYETLFPLNAIVKNTKNVVGNYIDEIKMVILHNIPIIIVMIVLFICLICLVHCIIKKYYCNKKKNVLLIFLTFILALIATSIYPFVIKNKNDFVTNINNYGLKIALLQSLKSNNEKLVVSDTVVDTSYIDENKNVFNINFNDIAKNETDEDYKSISNYISSVMPSNKNEYTGIFKGKNVVLICAEAFSYKIVDKELTPTLYKLINEGFRFNDFYVPSWGGSTTSGEFAFLTGLIPYHASESMKTTIGKNMSFTLPRSLKRLGYTTAAFHNGNHNYYDRNQTHKANLGFDSFYATGNGIEKYTSSFPDDISLINNTIVEYIDKQPFCLYYMSMTGHAYYNDDNSYKVKKYINRVKEVYGDKYPSQINNYICAQLYLEDALKNMLEILKENNIYDDTVICMVADHYPYGLVSSAFTNDYNYLADLYEEYNEDGLDRDKNMPILWSSSLTKEYMDYSKDIDSVSSTIDLLPTLLNLFGIEYDSRFLPGRDVMSDAPAYVIYNNGLYMTDSVKYIPKKGEYIWKENITGDINYARELTEKVKNKILFSDMFLNKNYFDYLSRSDYVPEYYKNIISENREEEIRLENTDLDGYIEYFKKCNKKYIDEKGLITKSRKDNTLYITIDDGPGANINYILDALKEKNVKATFFVTGTNHADDIRRIKSEGHVIGIHCYRHEYEEIYKDELAYLEDLYKEQKFLYETTGEYIHILRFPGGSNNSIADKDVMKRIISLIEELGFEYYDWNFSVVDSTNYENPSIIYVNFVNAIDVDKKQGIVLMHDLHMQTPLMLPYMIDYAREKGFVFDVINDYTATIHFLGN